MSSSFVRDHDTVRPNAVGRRTRPDELRSIVDAFQPGIVHAVGYGSGVFVQREAHNRAAAPAEGPPRGATGLSSSSSVDDDGVGVEEPMIDLLFTVSDGLTFHSQNLSRYPRHYSALARLFGPTFAARLQRSPRLGAGVYFNPLVDFVTFPKSLDEPRRRKIKYGVIDLDDLLQDLTEWRWLYVAGRMQKPTVTVEGLESDDVVANAQRINLDAALAAGLLLLGSESSSSLTTKGVDERRPSGRDGVAESNEDSYDLASLYERIAGLSYVGDPRMDVGGEDPDKITKLVRSPGQKDRFYDLYRRSLADLEGVGLLQVNDDRTAVTFNLNEEATRRELWNVLPRRVSAEGAACFSESEDSGKAARRLSNALANIVRPAARRQSLKGILTAGVLKSIRYAGAKFAKGAFRSRPMR